MHHHILYSKLTTHYPLLSELSAPQAKQQREAMQSEIAKRGAEIASLRSEVESNELRSEGLRAELAAADGILERKREKKRKWKVRCAVGAGVGGPNTLPAANPPPTDPSYPHGLAEC